jgi:AAA domain-containing protein
MNQSQVSLAADAIPNVERVTPDSLWTTLHDSPNHSIARIIKSAEECPQAWHIEDLWQPRTIMMVHSLEGEFKSIFAYQVAEALATGQPLLRKWKVPAALRVGVLQTEMADMQVGHRLSKMYSDGRIPSNLVVSDEGLMTRIRMERYAQEKFGVIHDWINREGIEVLVWDTINSILASCGNPNSEEAANQFYERLNSLPHQSSLVVRHDGKPSKDSENRASNQKIRGSNLHAEVASAIVHLSRPDKRKSEVSLEIGKLRHDSVPEPLPCWFDGGTMRLTPLPPPVVFLESGAMTRDYLYLNLFERFKIKERTADDQLKRLRKDGLLIARSEGHERVWALKREATPESDSPDAHWWPMLSPGRTNVADCKVHLPEICELTTSEGPRDDEAHDVQHRRSPGV